MTKKDYELIAGVMARLSADFTNGGEDTVSLSLVAQELADVLDTTNPRFDRARFLTACGVN
jgi:hypothetical protein